MPILSFSSQPSANGVAAAYRPVVLSVLAQATDMSQIPPVVYCDIYFNDVFYKTIAKQQYKELSGEASVWQFDVQDAAQEYLQMILGDFAENSITEAVGILTKCLCKLRSSGYDANGFIEAEDTAPVQGTDNSDPESGTGTESNTFYIQNAALQHEDNQDLVTHLSYFRKQGTWAEDAYPLSHRPNGFAVGPNSSDIFPILYTGSTAPTKIRVKYRLCGQSTFHSTDPASPTCIAPGVPEYELPVAQNGVAYSASFVLTGTAPFTLSNLAKPAWMSITVVGNTVYFSGTPIGVSAGEADLGFDISNCHEFGAHFDGAISVIS